MSKPERRRFVVLAALWVGCCIWFWSWWLRPEHVGNPALFAVVSLGLIYSVTILPSFYMFYLGHMRRPVPVGARDAATVAVVGRVAVITLTVPEIGRAH